MRFMIIVKADEHSEAGIMPTEKDLADMMKYNEELVKAGVMLAGDGLHPSSKGVRIRFEGDQRTVINGPFANTRDLISGYWIFQVDSKEEAIEWVKRAPLFDNGAELEIRQIFGPEDFGEALTPEIQDKWEELERQEKALKPE